MDAKQEKALARLLKKLSALRVTLAKDERDILDQFVLGARAEVAAHGMTMAKVSAARVSSAKVSAAKALAAEVTGHAMSEAVVFDAAKKVYRLKANAG